MQLFLIRHGEAAGDPHLFLGPPVLSGYLTGLGDEQAGATAQAPILEGLTHLYASPLGRALQTAQPLAVRCGLAIETHNWLREWQPATVLGRCEESQWEAIEAAAAALRPELAWRSGAGESTFEFAGRVIPGFLDLLLTLGVEPAHGGYVLRPEAEDLRVAIVAHGGTLGRLVAFLLGVPLSPYPPLSFEHAGLATFQFLKRVDVWYPTLTIPAPH